MPDLSRGLVTVRALRRALRVILARAAAAERTPGSQPLERRWHGALQLSRGGAVLKGVALERPQPDARRRERQLTRGDGFAAAGEAVRVR